jgi:hypothetical protein
VIIVFRFFFRAGVTEAQHRCCFGRATHDAMNTSLSFRMSFMCWRLQSVGHARECLLVLLARCGRSSVVCFPIRVAGQTRFTFIRFILL